MCGVMIMPVNHSYLKGYGGSNNYILEEVMHAQ